MRGEGTRDFWRLIAAYIVPPVGVFLQVGLGLHFWINLVLTVFFVWLPGVIHAVWVISTTGRGGRAERDGMQTFLSLLVSFFLPPIGVLMKKGVGVAFLVNLLLTVLLFWLPGVLHAAWVITHDEG